MREITIDCFAEVNMWKSEIHPLWKDYLVQDAEFTPDGFPKIKGTNEMPKSTVIYPESSKIIRKKDFYVNFFTDDYRFNTIWANPFNAKEYLKKFGGVFMPDFSMTRDMPLPVRKYQMFKALSLAHYYESEGIKVIPVAIWADETDYDWCFRALPRKSLISVCTNGVLSSDKGKEIFREGFDVMVGRLEPVTVIIVGREIELDYKNVIYMKSFGQRMVRHDK